VQIDLAALPDDPGVLQRMLQEVVPELQAENEKLWQLIQRLLRHRYGPRSEKLDLDQLRLVPEDAEESAAGSDTAKDEAAIGKTASHRAGQSQPRCVARAPAALRGRHRHRQQAMPLLWRHAARDRRRRSEMLDLVPAQLRVKVVCRPRYGCRTCEGAVVQASAPEQPIDGGMATEALVAHVVVSKFCDSRVSRTHQQRWRCGAM
jgi:transposase